MINAPKQNGTFFRVYYSNCKTVSKRHGNQRKQIATKQNEAHGDWEKAVALRIYENDSVKFRNVLLST